MHSGLLSDNLVMTRTNLKMMLEKMQLFDQDQLQNFLRHSLYMKQYESMWFHNLYL